MVNKQYNVFNILRLLVCYKRGLIDPVFVLLIFIISISRSDSVSYLFVFLCLVAGDLDVRRERMELF